MDPVSDLARRISEKFLIEVRWTRDAAPSPAIFPFESTRAWVEKCAADEAFKKDFAPAVRQCEAIGDQIKAFARICLAGGDLCDVNHEPTFQEYLRRLNAHLSAKAAPIRISVPDGFLPPAIGST